MQGDDPVISFSYGVKLDRTILNEILYGVDGHDRPQ
jgi:hypothetical protein